VRAQVLREKLQELVAQVDGLVSQPSNPERYVNTVRVQAHILAEFIVKVNIKHSPHKSYVRRLLRQWIMMPKGCTGGLSGRVYISFWVIIHSECGPLYC